MASEFSDSLRQYIAKRANYHCEYCRLPEAVSLYKHEPDHIISLQHGGETESGNLALACIRCNRYKGPNIASIDPLTGKLTPFFDPRTQDWSKHFVLDGAIIRPLTAEARVTVKIMRFNDDDRIAERQHLLEAGLYK